MTDAIKLHPSWRNAVAELVAAGRVRPGEIFTHEELYRLFDIPVPWSLSGYEEIQRAELRFLGAFDKFSDTLLTEHQAWLIPERGAKAYRVAEPREQSKRAEDEGRKELKRALRKMGARLTNVDLTALTLDERKDNADRLARLSMMRGMFQITRHRALAAPDKSETEIA